MGLQEYRNKRDFRKTPEPSGKVAALPGEKRPRYALQKHAARRLHYDLRLELDGTLKSWAVPRGPSLDPTERRLAVEVEDHPLAYAEFEGTIPQGQYGGGTVLLWDRGTWEPEADPGKGLRRGKLRFRLHGEKLQGSWLLVRMEGEGRGANWLLRKLEDEEARSSGEQEVLEERPESVASGRTLQEIASRARRVWRNRRRQSAAPEPSELPGARQDGLPERLRPQLATLVSTPPEGDDWLHELKLDGYRVLVRLEAGRARILTRQGHDWTSRFGRLAEAVSSLPAKTALLDGEVVALRPDGTPDFQALQQALGKKAGAALHLFTFDLLHLDGHDLRRTPLLERKRLLRELLAAAPGPAPVALRYSDHLQGQGGELFRHACLLGVEGIVSKRADAPYRSGRSRDWLKIKCTQRQELVVVGFTEPQRSRLGFGSLLLAYHDEGGRLRYAGRVGTGFDQRMLQHLRRRLEGLARQTSPLDEPPPPRARTKGVHWVEPHLVVEVSFGEWTGEGVLRHPSFVGVREDKPAADVRLERPQATVKVVREGGDATGSEQRREKMNKIDPPRRPRRRRSRASKPRDGSVEIAGVRLTSPERVLYPEQGITKRQLAAYYLGVAEVMLPELARRPLTLVRCPAGQKGECFYQKHLAEGVPQALVPVEIEERSGKRQTYVAVDSAAGLVMLAQLGVLEIHPWGSRAEQVERPDRLIFDLDPDPGIRWTEVVAAARALRALLQRLGLESFPKLTGGKGLHLVVPVVPELEWDEAKEFTRAVAVMLAAENQDAFTTNPAKAKRKGRIFVDYLRNGFGATAVAAYSTRARPGAPVAVPIRWDELAPRLESTRYSLTSVRRRLAAIDGDPWADMAELDQRIRPEILAEIRRQG